MIFLKKKRVGGNSDRMREKVGGEVGGRERQRGREGERERGGRGRREIMVELRAAKKELFDDMMKGFYKVVEGDTSFFKIFLRNRKVGVYRDRTREGGRELRF